MAEGEGGGGTYCVLTLLTLKEAGSWRELAVADMWTQGAGLLHNPLGVA